MDQAPAETSTIPIDKLPTTQGPAFPSGVATALPIPPPNPLFPWSLLPQQITRVSSEITHWVQPPELNVE